MSQTYEFSLLVVGTDVQSDDALNALAEAGCDDATVGSSAGVQHLDFDREAGSYAEAVTSAIRCVESAVRDAQVVRVLPDEYVTLAEIAKRVGRTRESVRLLRIGERGPGAFPPPAARGEERNKLCRWAAVAAWFASELGEPIADVIDWDSTRAVNAALDLRAASAGLDQVALRVVRQELGALLQTYRLLEAASPARLDERDEEWFRHAQPA